MANKLLKLSVVFLFFSCNSSDQQSNASLKKTDTVYYESGRIKEINEVIKDTIKDGLSLAFYEDLDTMSISFYKEGVKDSTEKLFYPSGDLRTIRSWRQGKLDILEHAGFFVTFGEYTLLNYTLFGSVIPEPFLKMSPIFSITL